MTKGTKIYSVFKNKCPKCHEGQFFETANPFILSKLSKMPDNCPVCGQKYEPETGFFYGAMYVSYALGVALFVAVWVAINVLAPEMGAGGIIAWVLVALFVFFPLNFKLSRLVWINIFVKYTGKNKNVQHNHN
jgi:hypothetical protein